MGCGNCQAEKRNSYSGYEPISLGELEEMNFPLYLESQGPGKIFRPLAYHKMIREEINYVNCDGATLLPGVHYQVKGTRTAIIKFERKGRFSFSEDVPLAIIHSFAEKLGYKWEGRR